MKISNMRVSIDEQTFQPIMKADIEMDITTSADLSADARKNDFADFGRRMFEALQKASEQK